MPAPSMMNSDGGEQHAAIEFLDLRLDLLLPRGQRHRQDGVARLDPHRRRGDEVLDRPHRLAADERRLPLEQDGAVHLARRARRQQARGKQVALARRQQVRAVEDVDVLRDHAAQPHDDVVVDDGSGGEAATCRLPKSSTTRLATLAGPRRLAFDVGEHQRRDVGARHERQRHAPGRRPTATKARNSFR